MTATYSHRERPGVMYSQLWEAFGCPPDTRQPTTVRKVKDHQEYDCLDPLTGISFIQIKAPGLTINAHGDDTSGVFLKVYGDNEASVRAMYERAAAILPSVLHHIWNTPLGDTP